MVTDNGSFEWPPAGAGGGGGGVSSLNSLTGALNLVAGSGITITPGSGNLTIAATAGSAITALTGDGAATGPGSVPLVLATVNLNVGTFGSASGVGSFTANGKGLVTAASVIPIQIAESQVTNLISDLAGKQATLTLGNITSPSAQVTVTGGTGAVVGSGTAITVQDANIYYHYPVVAGVIENDAVMNVTNPGTSVAPLSFQKATNNDTQYYVQIYGIAKNVSGGFADIYLDGTVVPGFNFGAFIGVDYYIDPTTPGALTFTPPVGQVNVIKMGRALDATHLILGVYSQFVQDKGALYTSDGSGYDSTLLVGSNGNVLVANSAAANGINWAPAVVAGTGLTYTTATRSLTLSNLAGDVTGAPGANTISAATVTGKLLTGYVVGANTAIAATDSILAAFQKAQGEINARAPTASPTFTGDVNASTGNVLVSTIGKGLQVKTGANSKIGRAVLVAGAVTVANTSVTANSDIFKSVSTAGGVQGFLSHTISAGTSFTITSTNALDTSTVQWMIVEQIP